MQARLGGGGVPCEHQPAPNPGMRPCPAFFPACAACSAGAATALLTYYLDGTGGGLLAVLNATMGLDVDASLAAANATLAGLGGAIADPASAPLLGGLGPAFDNVTEVRRPGNRQHLGGSAAGTKGAPCRCCRAPCRRAWP